MELEAGRQGVRAAGCARREETLSQLMVTVSDECCGLPVWHGTCNGFVPNCWWKYKKKKKMLAPTEWPRQSDSVCERRLGGHRAREP